METGDKSGAPPLSGARTAAQRAWRFGWIATGLLVAIMAGLAAAMRLDVFGAGFHLNFALILGVAGSILLGVGLMALSFYSDRSGADDGAAASSDKRPDESRQK